MKKELQEKLGLKDEDFGYHESDLYVVATPEVREYLRLNYAYWRNCTTFRCQVTGKMMLDIPFANEAFWEKVERKAKALQR